MEVATECTSSKKTRGTASEPKSIALIGSMIYDVVDPLLNSSAPSLDKTRQSCLRLVACFT
jgi:hypothetical protein